MTDLVGKADGILDTAQQAMRKFKARPGMSNITAKINQGKGTEELW